MLFKLCFCLAIAFSHVSSNGNLDSLIDDVFTKPRSDEAPKPCNNGLGECVAYYLCVNGSINTDGTDLLDIRLSDDTTECLDYFEQCCATGDVREVPQIPIPEDHRPINPNPPVNPGGPNYNGGGVPPSGNQGSGNIGSGGNQGIGGGGGQTPVATPICGFRNVEGVGFRITGNSDGESEYGEFPWMVAILKEELAADQVLNVYQCGGSIIHPSVILTAAHCVNGKTPQSLKVRAGEWDTQTKNELFPHTDHDVQKVIVHENFYKGGLHNDIALLILKNPVKTPFEQHVNTVCMPPQGAVFDHSRCFASGWGKDVFGKEGKYQVILKKIELPVVPFLQCQESLRQTRLGKRYNLHNSFVCAGGEPGKDTCKGDGGSPLVCPIKGHAGHYYQVGIVAWGIGCGENGTPGVYVNVPLFRNWIDEKVRQQGLDGGYYII